MTRSKATEAKLGELHGLLADTLKDQIKKFTDANEPVPPALLAQAIKFLKDNGIDQPLRAGNKVDSLADVMPDFDEMQDGARH